MNRIFIIILLMVSMLLACTDQEQLNNHEVTSDIENEIDWCALENMDLVEEYLSEQGIILKEGYETLFLNVTPNEVNELFVLPATDNVIHCITLDDHGDYKIIEGDISGDINSTLAFKEDLILVESDCHGSSESGRSVMIYRCTDDQIKKILTSPIIL